MLHPLIHLNLSSELDSSDCNAIVWITQCLDSRRDQLIVLFQKIPIPTSHRTVQRRKGFFLETNFLKGYYEPKVEFLKEFIGGEKPNQKPSLYGRSAGAWI